jgi:hypothetical protein
MGLWSRSKQRQFVWPLAENSLGRYWYCLVALCAVSRTDGVVVVSLGVAVQIVMIVSVIGRALVVHARTEHHPSQSVVVSLDLKISTRHVVMGQLSLRDQPSSQHDQRFEAS